MDPTVADARCPLCCQGGVGRDVVGFKRVVSEFDFAREASIASASGRRSTRPS